MASSDEEECFYDALEEFEDWEEFTDATGSFSGESGPATDGCAPSCSYDTENGNNSTRTPSNNWSSTAAGFPLHRAAFDGDIPRLKALLRASTHEQKAELDSQGNTVLHLAVLKDSSDAVEAILECGFPNKIRNGRGWTALDEAISCRNRALVSLLHANGLKELKKELKTAKQQLLKTLAELPDYSMKLNWQLGSPVLGVLLKKWAPHDTYTIWKRGTHIRVDGTLIGIEKQSTSLIPEWKRGNFSLLFDGSKTPAQLYLVFHEKQTYLDLTEEKQARKKVGQLDLDADAIISDGAGRTKLRAVDFRFKPVRGWLGSELTEKIEGWNTKVYEASGKMVAVTYLKTEWQLPDEATFEDYLNMEVSQDTVVEIPVNPTSLGMGSKPNAKDDSHGEEKVKKAKQPKKLTGRCWMAEDFPMSLRQLLPLLDVVGHANKHLGKVAKFMRKYGDMNMFPVKIQIPLLLTVYLLVSFKEFQFTRPDDPTSFEIPEGFRKVTLDEVMKHSNNKHKKNGNFSRPPREDEDIIEMNESEVIDF